MSSSWTLAVTNQLAGSLVQRGARELLNRPAVALEDLDAALLVSPDDAQESEGELGRMITETAPRNVPGRGRFTRSRVG